MPPRSPDPQDELLQFDVLAGGGRMGAIMRVHDWANSPLGLPSGWPQPRKTLVGLLLGADQPMFVGWGCPRASEKPASVSV
jgi:hypothetical protein